MPSGLHAVLCHAFLVILRKKTKNIDELRKTKNTEMRVLFQNHKTFYNRDLDKLAASSGVYMYNYLYLVNLVKVMLLTNNDNSCQCSVFSSKTSLTSVISADAISPCRQCSYVTVSC